MAFTKTQKYVCKQTIVAFIYQTMPSTMQTNPGHLIITKNIIVIIITSLNELYNQLKQSHACSLRNCCKHQNYLEPVNFQRLMQRPPADMRIRQYDLIHSLNQHFTIRWLDIIYNVSAVKLYHHYRLWKDIASNRRTVTEPCLCLLMTVHFNVLGHSKLISVKHLSFEIYCFVCNTM